MKYDPLFGKALRDLESKRRLIYHLKCLIKSGYAIFFTTYRFKPSRFLYAVHSQNPLKCENAWNDARNYHGKIIQEWLVRAYLGNTRSAKRAQDEGWEFIGRWERAANGFLHAHGFLAVFVGDNGALRSSQTELATRLCERSYHDDISSVHCAEWEGPDSGAVPYILKESWRPDSGEEFIFARAPDPSIIDQRQHLSASGTSWRPTSPKSIEHGRLRSSRTGLRR